MRERIADEESGISLDAELRTARAVVNDGVAERARQWIDWFGVTRLVTSAVAVVVVCVGAYWLIRTPAPPSEAALPVAGANGTATVPAATLVPPPTGAPVDDPTDIPLLVVVHVAGAVERPGVYELVGVSRVDDALDAAGGATADADPTVLNLAAPLVDGSRIYVPMVGEEVPVDATVQAPPMADEIVPSGPVDVNRGSASELETLPGVGPATAAAIITERDLNGPFASFEDLERVPGIGPAKLAALTGLVAT